MTVTQTVITALGLALAALISGWWARRGQTEVSSNTLALGLLTELRARVRQLEIDNAWRDACAVIERDYIELLRNHIIEGSPPPPPPRPIYPPRPT